MQRTFLLGAALTLACSGAALAQPAPATTAPAAAPPAATPPPASTQAPSSSVNPPASTGLKTGMVVKDGSGATVGTIAQIGQTADGRAAVMLNVDGKQIGILASNLSPGQSGAEAVSSLTKAQIQASAAQRPG
jgi:hypothetical protein